MPSVHPIGFDVSPSGSVTPGRRTLIAFDAPEWVLAQQGWALTRLSGQIVLRQPEIEAVANPGYGGWLLPSGSWAIFPEAAAGNWETNAAQAGIIRAADWNLAPNLLERPMHQRQEVAGESAPAPFVSHAADHFLHRMYAAGLLTSGPAPPPETWELVDDVAATPKPPHWILSFPMDRVAASKTTFYEGQGFTLRFHVPGTRLATNDRLLTFYFGGPTDVFGYGLGGEFALTLFASGRARLYERLNAGEQPWKQVFEFQWARAGYISGNAHQLTILPEGSDTLNVITQVTSYNPRGNLLVIARNVPRGLQLEPESTVFIAKHPEVPYTGKAHMTGPGPVRVDMMRGHRFPLQVAALNFERGAGLIADMPFVVDEPITEATSQLVVELFQETPRDSGILVSAHDAETGEALELLFADERLRVFAPIPGVQSYRLEFFLSPHFSGSGPPIPPLPLTPFLRGFQAWVPPEWEQIDREPFTGGLVSHVSITGVDYNDPTHETAALTIPDPAGELDALRQRGEFRTLIATRHDPNDLSKDTILFDGYLMRPGATAKHSEADQEYPVPGWVEFDGKLLGMWKRLAEQPSGRRIGFTEDHTAPPDPATGKPPAWQLRDIIFYVLTHVAGFAPHQVEIPAELTLRLFPVGGDPEQYMLQPEASPAEFLRFLVWTYFGATLYWEPNAGEDGVWRVRLPPEPPHAPIWNFTANRPEAGRLAGSAAAYGNKTTFIRRMKTRPIPPEANVVEVVGLTEGQQGPQKVLARRANRRSFGPGADANHPDYLGRQVKIIILDPTLKTPEAVGFIANRIFDFACHGRLEIDFVAPLVLIDDPTDGLLNGRLRPLRPYDVVNINGANAFIRNANPVYASDTRQWCHYQALFVLPTD